MTMYHNVSQLNVWQCMTIKFMTMYYTQLAQLVVVVALILAVFVFLHLSRFWFDFHFHFSSSKSRMIHLIMLICAISNPYFSLAKEHTIKISMMIIIWFVYDNHHMIIWAWWSSYDLQAVGTAVHSFRSDQS